LSEADDGVGVGGGGGEISYGAQLLTLAVKTPVPPNGCLVWRSGDLLFCPFCSFCGNQAGLQAVYHHGCAEFVHVMVGCGDLNPVMVKEETP
jgi:hypothetical protein